MIPHIYFNPVYMVEKLLSCFCGGGTQLVLSSNGKYLNNNGPSSFKLVGIRKSINRMNVGK